MEPVKPPKDCVSLTEVRSEIDRIDRRIIAAIGARRHYVIAAAKLKTSPAAVAAPERFAAMLEMRRQWAAEEDLDPNVVEKLYRDLVKYFISEEMVHWKGPSPSC